MLLMETAGDSSIPYARVSTYLQDLEPQVGKRRLSQARHRATLAGLFNNLRETVYSQKDNSASKISKPAAHSVSQSITFHSRCSQPSRHPSYEGPTYPVAEYFSRCRKEKRCQVLWKAKNYIHELEHTLEDLLKMKEVLNLEDGNPSSLEEVKEEYVKMYFNNHSIASSSNAVNQTSATVWYVIQEYENSTEEDVNLRLTQSPATSSPDLMEFERYLYFYKQTVDLLVDSGVVNSEEVTLPVVSTAVSHLWQGLPEERRESVLQYCSQRQKFISEVKTASQEPAYIEGIVRDSGANSQETSGSVVSTPEEVLFEDAFDMAISFLDRNVTEEIPSQSSAFIDCASDRKEDNQHLYLQIIEFLKSQFFANTQLPQEEVLQLDYETVMLRCTETFDDDDL